MNPRPSLTTEQPRPRISGLLAWLALAFAAVSAAGGLFIRGLYRDADGWVRQAQAADLATLLLVVPVLAVALRSAGKGSLNGRLAAIAALGYLVYTYAIFGFSVAINPMTVLHLATLGLAGWALTGSIAGGIGLSDSTTARRLPRRMTAAFLIGVATLFALMWLGQIATVVTTGRPTDELRAVGLATNPVYTLDLAFALPFLAYAGVRLGRRAPDGAASALVAVIWSGLMGAGVLAIFLIDALAGAAVPGPVVALVALITAASVALAIRGVGVGFAGGQISRGLPGAARPLHR